MRRTLLALGPLFWLLTVVPAAAQGVLTTVAGGGPHRKPATYGPIGYPAAVASAPDGSYYVADASRNQVFKVDPDGRLTVFAGFGGLGFDGDGRPAVLATLSYPSGLAIDRNGNVFIADTGNNRIRQVDALTGLISTVAGSGARGYSGDGGLATAAALRLGSPHDPIGLAADSAGNLFFADQGNNRIRRVDAVSKIITTFVGNCLSWADGVPAADGCLLEPAGLAIDNHGSLLIGSTGNLLLRKVDAATGLIGTIAGQGSGRQNVPASEAYVLYIYGIAVDADGNIFIADTDYDPLAGGIFKPIRRIDGVTGIITDYGGDGIWGYGGDGGPATEASFGLCTTLAVDAHGDLLVADPESSRVRKISRATGIVDTVAGRSWPASYGPPATDVPLTLPIGTAYDSAGNLFIANTAGFSVLRVDAITDIVTGAAGNGSSSSGGDGLPATQAGISQPYGIALDDGDNLFIADSAGQKIRRVDAVTGRISTVAGNGLQGYGGDGGPATNAMMNTPIGISFSASGDLYIADLMNNVVRRVDHTTQYISTVAGNGVAGFTGDGVLATLTSLNAPWGVAFDAASNLYISDRSNHRVRRVDALSGMITTVAGTGTAGLSGDSGPATGAMLMNPRGILVDPSGNLFIADSSNGRVRRVDAVTHNIETVAGTVPGSSPDGTIATTARLGNPNYVSMTPSGELLISDNGNHRIRKVTLIPPAPGEVPDGTSPYEPGLTVDQAAPGLVRLSWGASCSQAGGDFEIYEGNLGDFSSHAPALCTTGGSRSVSLPMPQGDRYYLVVPRNDLREGSYGRASDGVERPAGLAACVPQTAGTCGP